MCIVYSLFKQKIVVSIMIDSFIIQDKQLNIRKRTQKYTFIGKMEKY